MATFDKRSQRHRSPASSLFAGSLVSVQVVVLGAALSFCYPGFATEDSVSTPPNTTQSVDQPVTTGDSVPAQADTAQLPEQAVITENSPPAQPDTELPPDQTVAVGDSAPTQPDAAQVVDQPVATGDPAPAQADTAQLPEQAVATESALPEQPHGLQLLGQSVAPGTTAQLSWSPDRAFDGLAVSAPVLVVSGKNPGPVMCLTSAIHGDELNGIEIVRRVIHDLSPDELSGTVIGVPIVNLQGFHRSSRYLADRRDLNRFFPGNPTGSSAARIAHSFFSEVISHCDTVIDLHTASFYRTNLPQVRADLRNDEVRALANSFRSTVILQTDAIEGTLRKAASDAGIPAVALEAGEPMRLQPSAVEHGAKAVRSALGSLGMLKKISLWGQPEPTYYQSQWIRADYGGILFNTVKLGQKVSQGDLLGTVTDPITNKRDEIRSEYDGRVLGMALNQVVMPGFAAYRIGIKATESDILQSEPSPLLAPRDPLFDTSLLEQKPTAGKQSTLARTQSNEIEGAE